MKVLIYSPAFLPSLGGLEICQAQLAEWLVRLGQQVTVVTLTPPAGGGTGPDNGGPIAPENGSPIARDSGNTIGPHGDSAIHLDPSSHTRTAQPAPSSNAYRILRQPSPAQLLAAVRWCDVFFQANVSLRGLWPLLLVRRPWAVSHHSWYSRPDGRRAWQDRLKRRLLRHAVLSVAVSRAMAADLETPSLVIENAYRDELFRLPPGAAADIRRDRELAFLGRLVSDKGADILVEALARLAAAGLRPRLTVIGDGPESGALRRQAARLGVAGQIELAGPRSGGELVDLLARHRILVVPSRYHEPFGIAALEGIACGCVVVGSAGGGLPDAIGPCGRLFDNGDVGQLAAVLEDLLRHPETIQALRAGAVRHLAEHSGESVARRYLAALQEAVGTRR